MAASAPVDDLRSGLLVPADNAVGHERVISWVVSGRGGVVVGVVASDDPGVPRGELSAVVVEKGLK